MLILTRREGESLRIGEHVTVTVLRVKGSQVRIGISAPKDVTVQREEIAERTSAGVAVAVGVAGVTSVGAPAGGPAAEVPPR